MLRYGFNQHGGEDEAFCGIDVSMKETAVCVLDEAGKRIWEGTVRSSPDKIAAIIREKAPDLVRAGMETGPQAVWLWHALRECGIQVDASTRGGLRRH